jgi:hypothetical protein
VNRPAIPAKKEYHRRVSPIVLNGGRPRLIHSKPINPAKDMDATAAAATARMRLLLNEKTDAISEATMHTAAKYMNISHPIIFEVL